MTASADKKKVLIVNTNSGGHAVIGFYFAKELLASGHEVTVLTVGEEASDKMKKPPFSRFSVISPNVFCSNCTFLYCCTLLVMFITGTLAAQIQFSNARNLRKVSFLRERERGNDFDFLKLTFSTV